MADRIELTGLECFGYHGVFEEEKRTGQPFIVDITCWSEFAEAAATEAAKTTRAGATAALFHGVAAHVHDLALLRIQQDLLGQRGIAELLRGSFIIRIQIRVILAGHFAVGLLNLLVSCVFINTEDAVIVTSHC